MRRKVQIQHEGATLIVTVEDPVHGGEWEEVEVEIEGDALGLLEAFTGKTGGTTEYYRLMDKVGEEVRRQRRA